MTILRQGTLLRRVKDITLGTTLTIALLNGSVMLQSCGNNRSDETGGSYGDGPAEETVTFKKGVRSVITETAPGEFKITDETEAEPSASGAIVNYKDGHSDTLSVEAARKLVQNDPSTSRYFNDPGSYGQHHSNGLSNALLWGGLGYMLGRSTAPRYNEQRYSSGFYTNPNTYNRSQQIGRTVTSSRVVTSRPSGGRSGFFSRSSGGRGFSG
ncbi:hypothetical protein [uncultured Fibrella sp.]|uniref:hypothetical protein n=1 Tax=uncultured Fibrella sp. TaxID=1284596 RepID=UPI0035CAA762